MLTDANRCPWAKSDLDRAYHDAEWGRPLTDSRALFGLLLLEGAQAGLSWTTILKKRERYLEVFDGFDPVRIARYDTTKVAALLADPGIVRNRLKVAAAITNAQAFLRIEARPGAFSEKLWSFVDGRPLQPRRRSFTDIPVRTPESDAMSAWLQDEGFKFVGTTICYAFMQAAGFVNDHLLSCPCHAEAVAAAKRCFATSRRR
jgi:DNA-3-methyladenine glycosylase I